MFHLIGNANEFRVSPLVLLFGIGMIVGGVMLMLSHLKSWQAVQASEKDSRVRQFEFRKFRRRGIVACLLTMSGCFMAALYWAVEARVFAMLIILLLAPIIAALGLAIMDLVLVGLKMAEPDEEARTRMVEELQRLKELQKQRATESDPDDSDSTPASHSTDSPAPK